MDAKRITEAAEAKVKHAVEKLEAEVLEEVGRVTHHHELTYKGMKLEEGEHVSTSSYHGIPVQPSVDPDEYRGPAHD